MAHQSKKNLHSTILVTKNTINKKAEIHANNQKCSQTKKQSENSKAKNLFFSKLKRCQAIKTQVVDIKSSQ